MATFRHMGIMVAAWLLLTLPAVNVTAMEFESGEKIHISNLHHLEDDLFAWGESIIIDGQIDGDLFAGSYSVVTNGHVRSSAHAFAFKYRHTGRIDGSLRIFANECIIDGFVGRSALIMGNEITVGRTAIIDQDAVFRGNILKLDGTIKGNTDIKGADVMITGRIDGDLLIKADKIAIIPPAVINGNLTYTCEDEAQIDTEAGVVIGGETTWKLPDEDGESKDKPSRLTLFTIQVSRLLAAFLFGIILLAACKRYAVESVKQLRERFTVATATGFLGVLVFIAGLLILVVAAISVPLGMSLISGSLAPVGVLITALAIVLVPITSLVTVSGGVLFYSGKIIAAFLVGYLVMRWKSPDSVRPTRSQLLIGLIILTAAFAIPLVGLLLYLLISIIGAGAIILGIKHCRATTLTQIEEPPERAAEPMPPADAPD
ncbi:MAG: hypothetical protein KAU36_00670 [candidate division Zixibacteria bacterium]|nr:hypothetical protein [candidate division Zixibacteria bacterium]